MFLPERANRDSTTERVDAGSLGWARNLCQTFGEGRVLMFEVAKERDID